jgi:predicted tellurium resistance membrane protein TerC
MKTHLKAIAILIVGITGGSVFVHAVTKLVEEIPTYSPYIASAIPVAILLSFMYVLIYEDLKKREREKSNN